METTSKHFGVFVMVANDPLRRAHKRASELLRATVSGISTPPTGEVYSFNLYPADNSMANLPAFESELSEYTRGITVTDPAIEINPIIVKYITDQNNISRMIS